MPHDAKGLGHYGVTERMDERRTEGYLRDKKLTRRIPMPREKVPLLPKSGKVGLELMPRKAAQATPGAISRRMRKRGAM